MTTQPHVVCLYSPGGGTIDVNGLCQLMSRRMKEMSTTKDELRDAFQVSMVTATGGRGDPTSF